jgi:hypothetical protein
MAEAIRSQSHIWRCLLKGIDSNTSTKVRLQQSMKVEEQIHETGPVSHLSEPSHRAGTCGHHDNSHGSRIYYAVQVGPSYLDQLGLHPSVRSGEEALWIYTKTASSSWWCRCPPGCSFQKLSSPPHRCSGVGAEARSQATPAGEVRWSSYCLGQAWLFTLLTCLLAQS